MQRAENVDPDEEWTVFIGFSESEVATQVCPLMFYVSRAGWSNRFQ